MANNTADKVMGAGGLERNSGGPTIIRSDGIPNGAPAIVTFTHFIHVVTTSIIEHYTSGGIVTFVIKYPKFFIDQKKKKKYAKF